MDNKSNTEVESENLTVEDLNYIQSWLKENSKNIPENILDILSLMLTFCMDARDNIDKQKKLVDLLRKHMGFVPKSEKNSNKSKTTKKDIPLSEQAKALKQKMKDIAKQYTNIKQQMKLKFLERKKKQTEQKNNCENTSKDYNEVVDTNTPIIEGMFVNNNSVPLIPNEVNMTVNKLEHFPDGASVRSSFEERTRSELELSIINYKIKVESCTDPISGKTVTASTEELGPKYFNTTYKSIANVVTMVVGFGTPIVRLAKMLENSENSYFSASNLTRHIAYAAKCCSPIYVLLGTQLANANILSGDDTNTRELETERDVIDDKLINKLKEIKDSYNQLILSEEQLKTATKEDLIKNKLIKTNHLFSYTEESFGYLFQTTSGKNFKTKLNTSVLSGKIDLLDYRSGIVFYRTHLGSLGNLIGSILHHRTSKEKELIIQSDLSSANKPTYIPKGLKITTAGCGSHARRPFKRFEEDDYESCLLMQQYFLELNVVEANINLKKMDEAGCNNNEIIKIRKELARPIWENIKNNAQEIKKKWPPNSDIYKAADYIINNYEELTFYITNAHIALDNNLSERFLRYEKIMLSSSKFRATRNGRVVYDILRTIITTCNAAGVNLQEYLIFIMKNKSLVADTPEKYTPFNFAKQKMQ